MSDESSSQIRDTRKDWMTEHRGRTWSPVGQRPYHGPAHPAGRRDGVKGPDVVSGPMDGTGGSE